MDDLEVRVLDAAIQEALVPHGAVLIEYVVVAVYHDGEHLAIIGEQSEDLTPWGRAGLLEYAATELDWEDGDDGGI